MKAGGKDGANTRTGLIYEDKVDLATFIAKQKKYTVKDCGVLNLGECVAHIFKKYECPHVSKLAKFKPPRCPIGVYWNTLCLMRDVWTIKTYMI